MDHPFERRRGEGGGRLRVLGRNDPTGPRGRCGPKTFSVPLEGKVVDVYPGGKFLVETQPETSDEPMTIQAHLSGKLRRYRIKVVLGDRVTVEVSPYDLKKGRITYRFK